MSKPHTPDSIFHAIVNQKEEIPAEAIQAADGFQQELAPRLLQWFEGWGNGPKSGKLAACATPLCVVLLLARWRRREAFPAVLRWIDTPEPAHQHLQTMVTDYGPSVLASVWDENLERMTRVVRDETLSDAARETALMATVLAGDWGRLEPAALHAWQISLLTGRAFPKGHDLWIEFVSGCIRSGNKAAHPHLAKAYEAGWLPSEYIAPNEWVYGRQPEPGSGDEPIDDVAWEVTGWMENEEGDEWLFGSDEPEEENTTVSGARS